MCIDLNCNPNKKTYTPKGKNIKSDVLRNVKLVKLTVEFLKFSMCIAMVPVETASRKR